VTNRLLSLAAAAKRCGVSCYASLLVVTWGETGAHDGTPFYVGSEPFKAPKRFGVRRW
jgi:hypothetical protein